MQLFARELADLIAAELAKSLVRKDLYTVEEAAIYLGCSPETVRRFKDSKSLPCVKIDSRPRFRLRDLESFVERSIV